MKNSIMILMLVLLCSAVLAIQFPSYVTVSPDWRAVDQFIIPIEEGDGDLFLNETGFLKLNTSTLNSTYLRLDTSNDPLTGDLEINANLDVAENISGYIIGNSTAWSFDGGNVWPTAWDRPGFNTVQLGIGTDNPDATVDIWDWAPKLSIRTTERTVAAQFVMGDEVGDMFTIFQFPTSGVGGEHAFDTHIWNWGDLVFLETFADRIINFSPDVLMERTLTVEGDIIAKSDFTTEFDSNVGIGTDTPMFFEIQSELNETAQGRDRISAGWHGGTSRVLWENSGFEPWEIDASGDSLRFYRPGNVIARLSDVSLELLDPTELIGFVNWTNLRTYPVACPAGSAITELGDTVTCTDSWVNIDGDNMTGDLGVDGNVSITGDLSIDGNITLNLNVTGNVTASDFIVPEMYSSGDYSTLNDFFRLFTSAGRISGGMIYDNGNRSVNVSAGQGVMRIADDDISQVKFIEWSEKTNVEIQNDTISYIGVDYNSGSPIVVNYTNSESWDLDTNFPLGSVINQKGDLYRLNDPWWVSDGMTNIIERFQGQGTERDKEIGGLILSYTGTRNPTLSAGTLWARLNEFSITAKDCSGADQFYSFYRDGGTGWTRKGLASQWNNTHYDDNSGTLQVLDNNKYANIWVFVEIDKDTGGQLMLIYPQNQYVSKAGAEAEEVPSFPASWYKHGVLIGRILFKKGVDAPVEVQSSFVTQFTSSQAADHGNLGGLADDDHLQYLLVAGTRAMTGNIEEVSGSAANPSYTFTDDPNTGIYNRAEDTISFSIGGTHVGEWNSGGDLEVSNNTVVGNLLLLAITDAPDGCDVGTEGGMYYDNSLSEPCFCDGTNWKQVDGGGNC